MPYATDYAVIPVISQIEVGVRWNLILLGASGDATANPITYHDCEEQSLEYPVRSVWALTEMEKRYLRWRWIE